jgi:hypothetical protein
MKTSNAKQLRSKPRGRHSFAYVIIGPQVKRHLLKYGKNNVVSAAGNLSKIASTALAVAMLNRNYLQAATDRIIRYWKSEGFDLSDQEKLVEAFLAGKK